MLVPSKLTALHRSLYKILRKWSGITFSDKIQGCHWRAVAGDLSQTPCCSLWPHRSLDDASSRRTQCVAGVVRYCQRFPSWTDTRSVMRWCAVVKAQHFLGSFGSRYAGVAAGVKALRRAINAGAMAQRTLTSVFRTTRRMSEETKMSVLWSTTEV